MVEVLYTSVSQQTSTTDHPKGTVRKAMGVKFLGETHEDVKIHIVDARVEGLECGSVSTCTDIDCQASEICL